MQNDTAAPTTTNDQEFLADFFAAGTVLECGCCDSHGHRI